MSVNARPIAQRALFLSAAASTALTLSCQHVAPYSRGRLAHPTMATGDRAGPAEAHVYAVQEGALGGSPGAESGCGCN